MSGVVGVLGVFGVSVSDIFTWWRCIYTLKNSIRMDLRCVHRDNQLWYDWKAVQCALNGVEPCALPLKFEQFPGKLSIDGTWMTKGSMQKFFTWYSDTCSYGQLQVVRAVLLALKPKRSVSKKYRWEIAYRQEYKCAVCLDLLHPKAMDIDHIVELSKGGEDTVKNCQALCANCHAKKSRGVFSKYFH